MYDQFKATIHSAGYVSVETGSISRNISIKDYLNLVNKAVSEGDHDVESISFKYPQSIHSVTNTASGYIVNLYYEETEAKMTHASAGSFDMYIPNVMVSVHLLKTSDSRGFSIRHVYWFATDKSRQELGTQWPAGHSSLDHIWTLPFPNMYSDSHMCMGRNQVPSVIYYDWTVLDMLYRDVFLGSAFNNDLSVPSNTISSVGNVWMRHLGEHYKDEETSRFPYEQLVNY